MIDQRTVIGTGTKAIFRALLATKEQAHHEPCQQRPTDTDQRVVEDGVANGRAYRGYLILQQGQPLLYLILLRVQRVLDFLFCELLFGFCFHLLTRRGRVAVSFDPKEPPGLFAQDRASRRLSLRLKNAPHIQRGQSS